MNFRTWTTLKAEEIGRLMVKSNQETLTGERGGRIRSQLVSRNSLLDQAGDLNFRQIVRTAQFWKRRLENKRCGVQVILPLQIELHANRNTKSVVNLAIRKFPLHKNLRNVPSLHFQASNRQQRRQTQRKVRIFLLFRTGSSMRDACALSRMLSVWF